MAKCLSSVFFCEYYFHIFQSRDLQRCHKQAGCCISPGHHVADTELQILVCFSSNFLAIFTLCSSVVRLKMKGNYFKWIEIIIFSLVLSLTFQLKANDCLVVYLFTYANEGCESKTKDSVYNTHLNFRSFFSGKKVRIIHG